MRWVLGVLVVVGVAVLVAPPAFLGLGSLPLEANDDPDDTPEATADSETKGPALGGTGHARERSPTQRRTDLLGSADATTAAAALRWLRDAHAAERLTLRELFDIAMLTGLSKEAEVFRKRAWSEVTKGDVDLGPFVDDLLAMVRTTDANRLERVTRMLASALASWRHRKLVGAAEEAGKPIPAKPLAGRFDAVREVLLDPRVDLRIRVQLAERIAWLGPSGVALFPSLLGLIDETNAAFAAWRAEKPSRHPMHYPGPRIDNQLGQRLAEFGAAILPKVLPLLRSEDDVRKDIARDTLSALGAAAEPALLRALRDPDADVRESAAWSLTWADDASAERIAALAEAARTDEAAAVRHHAAGALIYQGEAAIGVAAELLRGDDVGVRAAIIESLEYKDELIRDDLLRALVERYENPDEDETAELLGIIENAGSALVPATYGILRLLPKYEYDGMSSRQDLLLSLGDAALPWFLTALESDVEDLHHYAARGLGWAGPLQGELRARAQKLLRDGPDAPHRIWLAAAVADERDPVSLRILDEALDHGPWETRHIAATTLAAMEGLGTRYLDRLVAASVEASELYYDMDAEKPHGMVGISVDMENAWKQVVERDFSKAFPLLDHPSKFISRNAAWMLRNNAGKVAPKALELWPTVAGDQRGLFLELMGAHPDFSAVQDRLVEEAAVEPRTKPTKRGAPMPATEILLRRAPAGTTKASAAARLVEQAMAGNLWAWNAVRRTKKHGGAAAASAALHPYFDHTDEKVRTRARKLDDAVKTR